MTITSFEYYGDCDGWTQKNPDCDFYFCYCTYSGFTGDCTAHCPNGGKNIHGDRFGESEISKVMPNPFSFSYSGGSFTLKFQAWDQDGGFHFGDDHMATMRVHVTPSAGAQTTHVTRGSGGAVLKTSFQLRCSSNYYGDQCAVYCSPPTHGYCNQNGRVVCHTDYYSPSTGCSRHCIKPTHGYCDSSGNVVCNTNYYSPSTSCMKLCIPPTNGYCDSSGNMVCHANYYSPSTRCGTHCVTPNNGYCNSSGLTCNEGWTGTDCSLSEYV